MVPDVFKCLISFAIVASQVAISCCAIDHLLFWQNYRLVFEKRQTFQRSDSSKGPICRASSHELDWRDFSVCDPVNFLSDFRNLDIGLLQLLWIDLFGFEVTAFELGLSHGCERSFSKLVWMVWVGVMQGKHSQVVKENDFPVRILERIENDTKIFLPKSELIFLRKLLAQKQKWYGNDSSQ